MSTPTDQGTTEVDASEHTGGMIALIPADPYPHALAVPGGLPPTELHLTLAYLGDDVTTWGPELRVAVRSVIRELAGNTVPEIKQPVPETGPSTRGPLTLTVFAHSHFNPTGADGREPCMVYEFDNNGDRNAVEALAGDICSLVRSEIGEVNFPEQHAPYRPHITAGYGLTPDALNYVGPVVFDRIRVAFANEYTDIPLGGDPVTAAAPTAPAGLPAATSGPIEVVEDTGDEIRVRWPVFLLEGLDTSDNGGSRYIKPGAITARALPLSLMGQPYTAHGGQAPPPAEIMGKITALTQHPGPTVLSPRTGQPYPDDVTVWSGEGVVDGTHRFADLVRKQYLRGTSADLAGTDAELVDEDEAALSANPRRRVIVTGGEIAGGTLLPIPAFGDAYCELVDEATVPEPLAASAFPVGMLLEPQPMWRARELGDYPGDTLEEDTAVTAAAPAPTRTRPPLTCFTDPGFDRETPITIEDCGDYRRVYGHIGTWHRPHIGFNGRQIYIPRSRCDYAEFLRGGYRAVDENGDQRIVAVGHLTMDVGHADLSLGTTATAHHYDHSGYTWADVAVGDDEHGPWVNGVVRPMITEDQVDRALASPPSGDWRPIGGGLELVAVLHVNTPGFGVYRARVASGQVQALVASSLVQSDSVHQPAGAVVLDYDTLADALAARLVARQEQATERAALLASLDDTQTEREELLAALADDDASFDVSRMPPKLRQSYLRGKASAKIGWGTPGDFDRCVAEARHHGVPVHMRKGMCATLHKKATGQVPGNH